MWSESPSEEGPSALSLTRFGLSFRDPKTESVYRSWQTERALAFIRIGMVASLMSWVAVLALYGVAFPEQFPLVAAVILVVSVPTIVAAMVVTYLPSRRRLVMPFAAFGNLTAGLIIPVLAIGVPHPAVVLMGGTVTIQFFCFTIFRFRPVTALVTAFPYTVVCVASLIAWWRRADVVDGEAASYLFLPVLIYVVGFLASLVIDRTSRDSFRQQKINEAQRAVIERERARADGLLYSVFPSAVADRLKGSTEVIAQRADEVTVLFADLIGFTPLSARLSPEQVVALLNDVFVRFDGLVAELRVEKIKTIGDAYLAVAGVPEPRADHAEVMAKLALAMRAAVSEVAAKLGEPLALRVGLCSGPVVAGVIGKQRFAYDVWGDTVNTAARMESQAPPGGIQLAESTASRLPPSFTTEERGVIDVKGKGPMKTWLLSGERLNG